MKKLMALFIATLLALSCAAMAEAPGFHAEGMPIVDEPVTIRVLTMRWADMGDSFADNPFLVNLEKESNVKIDWQIVSSNDWGDQKPIMLAGGTEVLPDVVLGFQTFNESDIMSNVEYFVPLEDMIENRKNYVYAGGEKKLQPVEGAEYCCLVQYPIIASGDVCGSVMYLMNKPGDVPDTAEQKLIAAAAAFLGKQMEE